jgi:hypothetical protein
MFGLVSLQGAGRRVAGADTNDYPAGVPRAGRPDRIRRFVARTCPYARENPAAHCRQRLRAASRDGHRIGRRWSFRTCASATGGGISGVGATSPPPAATSRRLLVDLELIGDFGLGDANGRSALDEAALFGSRLIFGWHFPFRDGPTAIPSVTRSHVDLEFAAAQLVLEMLAQRLLVDLEPALSA